MLAAVGELLERVGVDATEVVAEELPHNRWLSPGVWRIRTREGRQGVLKYARSDRSHGDTPSDAHWTARDHDPRRWTYWCREPLAYQHDLAEAYAGSGIRAPACLGAHVDDLEAVLLLEWVKDEPGEAWPNRSYGPAAEALGRAQAPFLLTRPLPPFPWLSRRFLREYSSEKPVAWELLDDDDAWAHPVVRRTFPPGLREGVLFVHAHRERLYQISESLPRTLCHLDFWPKNLFRRAGGEIVIIDWSFAGDGAIGEDVGNLVPDAVFDHFVAADEMPRLEQIVFHGYLRGLRAVRWDDDPQLVQLGMWSSAVKYDWLAALTLAQIRQDRQYRYGGAGEIDAAFKFRERSRALLHNARWARQAIELASKLGL
ncbi:MAG TPA: phosphotransferase [Streptosporangiaceae bacterium]